MTETTTETTNLDFELVAQAARLVAPVSNGPSRSRRVLPVPPPPPSVWAVASTQESARTPAPTDVANLLAWEEAAEQLEPDWATPVDDEDVAEHTAPLVLEVSGEPSGEATKLPLIAIEASDPPKALDAGTLDALAIVEANMAAGVPAEAMSTSADQTPNADAPVAPAAQADATTEAESELEALARSVTKSALDSLAMRGQAPGRPLAKPPAASRASAATPAAARSKSPASSSTCEPDAPARLHGHALDAGPDAAARRHGHSHDLAATFSAGFEPSPTSTSDHSRAHPADGASISVVARASSRAESCAHGHARDRSASPASDFAPDGRSRATAEASGAVRAGASDLARRAPLLRPTRSCGRFWRLARHDSVRFHPARDDTDLGNTFAARGNCEEQRHTRGRRPKA